MSLKSAQMSTCNPFLPLDFPSESQPTDSQFNGLACLCILIHSC